MLQIWHMILDKNTITYKGLPLFERATMQTPARLNNDLKDVACFFYMVKGTYEAVEAHGSYQMSEKEALIKRCGRYVAHFFESAKSKNCEAVAIYLFPDVLHEIYKNEVPLPPQKNRALSPEINH